MLEILLETKKDYIHIDDFSEIVLTLIEKEKWNDVYNIGSGKEIKVNELLKKLVSMSKKEIKIEVDPTKFRPVDVPLIVCDNTKIKRDTGWEVEFFIDNTLKEVLEYWRNIIK